MGLSWNSLSMEEITALYLFGESSAPNDLTSGAIVNRPGTFEDGTVGATITIDAVSYMDDGPGRFSYGSLSGLVGAFMEGAAANQDLKNNVAHTVGKNGEVIFSKADIMNYFISDGVITDKEVAINTKQYNYQDGTDDIAKRTYISNSTAFQLVDDAQFVIDADGARHIDNYAFIPRLKSKQYPGENFDLTGGDWE